MNEQPKSKVLIIFIGVLLVANIVLLSVFVFSDKQNEKKEKADKSAYITDFLKKEIGFDSLQMARYDSLNKNHHDEIKPVMKNYLAERKIILTEVASASFTDSVINIAAKKNQQQKLVFELDMLRHIRNIRSICTAAQLATFDTGFYKIFGRRGESYKEK